jgi:DNA-binding CsgD family transcriptional regulator
VAGVGADGSSGRLRAAREVRGFVRSVGPAAASPGAAAATLAVLHGVLPYDCASLARWDPLAQRHTTVAAVGYPDAAVRFLEVGMHVDPLFGRVRNDGGPLRVRDIPRPDRRGAVFDAVIGPLGFADGVTQCLFSRDGRYLGMLNASTLDGADPDDDAVALLALLADEIGMVLDPLSALGTPVRALADGESDGVLVTGDGAATALTPRARPDLAGAGSPVRPLLSAVLAGRPAPGPLLVLAGAELFAVVLDGGPQGVVLLHRPAAAPFGLTPRELEVLDAVSRGGTNADVARALRITPRTVATHVEHVLAKTGATNRAAAARLAARLGLVVRGRPDPVG